MIQAPSIEIPRKKAPSGLGKSRSPRNQDTGSKKKVQARKEEKQAAKRSKKKKLNGNDPLLTLEPAFPDYGKPAPEEPDLPTTPPGKSTRDQLDEEKLAAFRFERLLHERRYVELDRVEGTLNLLMQDLVKEYETLTGEVCNAVHKKYHKELRRLCLASLDRYKSRWIERFGGSHET